MCSSRYTKYLKVYLKSIICSVAVLEATNSYPYVAVSTVACVFEYESIGVLFIKCYQPVKDLPIAKQWFKFASAVVVVVTVLPKDLEYHLVLSPEHDPKLYEPNQNFDQVGKNNFVHLS